MPQCEATCVQTFERGHESTPYTPLLILNNEAESPMRTIEGMPIRVGGCDACHIDFR